MTGLDVIKIGLKPCAVTEAINLPIVSDAPVMTLYSAFCGIVNLLLLAALAGSASARSIYYIQKFFDLPNVVGDTGFHSGGDPQGLVYSAEVVPSKVQSQHSVKFFPFLRERIGEPGEPAHLHSHSQVLALDMGSADLGPVGIAEDRDGFTSNALGGRVSRFTLGVRGVHLDQLREVNALRSQAHNNGILIRFESVRGDLETTLRSRSQFFSEGYRIPLATSSKVPSKNQFAVSLNSNKGPGITNSDFISALTGFGFFLHSDISPKLITLHFFDSQSVDALVHQLLTPNTSEGEKIQNSSGVNSGDSGSRADAATLYQVLQNTHSFFFGQEHIAEWPWLNLYERFSTIWAAISLLAFSVFPKFLSWHLAGLAVHFVSPSEQHKLIKSRKHCQVKSFSGRKKVFCGGIQ